MSLHLHNTLTRRLEPFEPLDPAGPTMYVCGPTVYNYVHIGNARGPVVFGVLADLLRRRFGALRYARNITDVDDKINAAAQEQGVPISAITDRFAAAYREDMAALGVPPPDLEPAATAHIGQIVAMIERLIANGNAYAAEGHVLFSVASYGEYGKLSRRDPEEMLAGARVDVAPYKRDAGDFVLWKPSTADLPGWDSPWGRGRPGWHIECSAMTYAILGARFDIHAGGMDLKFPHHENEIAQSCAATGEGFANLWMHNGFVNVDDEKMSKSLNNFFRIRDVLDSGHVRDPEVLRFFLSSSHYRGPINYSLVQIEQADAALTRLYTALRDVEPATSYTPGEGTRSFESAMDDDFNTPDAIAALQTLATEVNRAKSAGDARAASALAAELKKLGGVMGILQAPAEAFLRKSKSARPTGATQDGAARPQQLTDEEIERLIAARREARGARNFKEADRIRNELAARDVILEDKPDGTTTWRRA